MTIVHRPWGADRGARRSGGTSARTALLLLLACGAVGAAVAVDARVFLAIPVVGAFVALCGAAYRRPRQMLSLAMLLTLVACTKFGNRDDTASLSGTVDGSVVLELGLYAAAALIIFLAVISPQFSAERLGVGARLGVSEWLLVAFAAVAVVSTVWSDAPMFTLVRAGQLVILLALAFVASRLLDVAGTIHALGTTTVAYVLVCATIAVAFPGTRVSGTVALATERFSWFGMHSISAAIFTAIAILYLLGIVLFIPGGWKQRRIGLPVWLTLLPLSAVMVATNSRGPLFALLGAIAAVVVVHAVRPVTALVTVAVTSLTIVVASVAGVTPSTLLDDVAHSSSSVSTILLRGQSVHELGTLTGRTELWSDLIPLYLDRPVVGYGYQASRAVLLRLRPWAGHAHNAILQTLLDLGCVGAVLLWSPFFWTVCARRRTRSPAARTDTFERASVFAMAIFMLINSVTDVSPAGGPAYETLVFLCMIVVAERLARRETSAAAAAQPIAMSAWARRAAPRVV